MYKRFTEIPTKSDYCKVVQDTITYVETITINDNNPIYPYILNQLRDIHKVVIVENSILESEDIYERYDIGAIGIQYFDEDNEMHERLCDIFYGTVHYNELK